MLVSKDKEWVTEDIWHEVVWANQLDVDKDEELPLFVLGDSRTTPIQVDVYLMEFRSLSKLTRELPCQ